MEKRKTSEPETVDQYIAGLAESDREDMARIRQAVRKAIPQAEEGISYGMPMFRYHGMVLYYASFTKHHSIFIGPEFKKFFIEELKRFSQTKAAVHFPKGSKIPVVLIARIARYIAKHNLQKFELKSSKGARIRKSVPVKKSSNKPKR